MAKSKKGPTFQELWDRIDAANTSDELEEIGDIVDGASIVGAFTEEAVAFLEEELENKMFKLEYPDI